MAKPAFSGPTFSGGRRGHRGWTGAPGSGAGLPRQLGRVQGQGAVQKLILLRGLDHTPPAGQAQTASQGDPGSPGTCPLSHPLLSFCTQTPNPTKEAPIPDPAEPGALSHRGHPHADHRRGRPKASSSQWSESAWRVLVFPGQVHMCQLSPPKGPRGTPEQLGDMPVRIRSPVPISSELVSRTNRAPPPSPGEGFGKNKNGDVEG